MLAGAAVRFLDQADLIRDDWYRGNQFYRQTRFYTYGAPQQQLRELYKYWQDDCYARIHEATAAANWLADVVRSELDPMFFAVEGKFLLDEHINLDHHTILQEYTELQRSHYANNPLEGFAYPEKLADRFREISDLEEQLEAKNRD